MRAIGGAPGLVARVVNVDWLRANDQWLDGALEACDEFDVIRVRE